MPWLQNLNLMICMGLGPHSILNKLIPFTWQIQSERRHLLIMGPTATPLGAALTPPLVILLKLSCFYLHSGCVHPVPFLLAFCKGCELHPGSFGAVSVPCDYTLWGRQKLWMSYNSKHTAVHFFFFLVTFVVTHRNKLPKLETDIEQWLSSSSRKIQNICKKIIYFGNVTYLWFSPRTYLLLWVE